MYLLKFCLLAIRSKTEISFCWFLSNTHILRPHIHLCITKTINTFSFIHAENMGGANFCTYLCIKYIVQNRKKNAARSGGLYFLSQMLDWWHCHFEQELKSDWSAHRWGAGTESESRVEVGIRTGITQDATKKLQDWSVFTLMWAGMGGQIWRLRGKESLCTLTLEHIVHGSPMVYMFICSSSVNALFNLFIFWQIE